MATVLSETRDGVMIVRFVDPELTDQVRIRQIGGELIALAMRPGVKQMLLNFDGVAFMTSPMLGQLAVLSKRCTAQHVGLKMCEVAAAIREVLRIVRLDTLAEILEDERAALAALRRERRHKAAEAGQTVGSELEPADTYRSAAAQGDAQAQYQLARCHEAGFGVEEDFAEGQKWYERAAAQGHAGSQFALATWYAYGIHVDQDYDEAVNWYRRAADQGHADAQYAMGMNYAYGLGVPADLGQADAWYRKAAERGHAKAREALAKLESDRAR